MNTLHRIQRLNARVTEFSDITRSREVVRGAGVIVRAKTLRHNPTGARVSYSKFTSPSGAGDHLQIGYVETPAAGRRKGGATALLGRLKAVADRTGLPIHSGATNSESGPLMQKLGFRKASTPQEAYADRVYDPKPRAAR